MHGYLTRDGMSPTELVRASGPMSVHLGLFRQLSHDVTYLAHALRPTAEQYEQLLARGIRVAEGAAAGLQVENDRLTGVRLADGGAVPCTVLVVATRMTVRTGRFAGLGLAPVAHPFGVGEHLTADAPGRTEVAVDALRGDVPPGTSLALDAQTAGAR